MAECCNQAWLTLEKYYNFCDKTPAYYAAMVRKLWKDEYQGQHSPPSNAFVEAGESLNNHSKRTMHRSFDDLIDHKRIKTDRRPARDAYEHYCNQPLEPEGVDALKYWNVQYEAGYQPDLCQMALDLLAIPSMSAECERVFSATKILITDRRNRLKDDIIEACECLRY
ncbi:uncharacterized protein [Primulina huaijiensis]|uniref:uncharacterized protein n=1 Tax=Primulina huaijiensis TaxID=1492673 RepID=UPI003CC74CC5